MLDPATSPEDHRGGTVSPGRAHPRNAREALRGGPPGRVGHRLHRSGHRRVHGRRRGLVLLPGDEHPPAGRAPRHRAHHRTRPGRAADRRRRRCGAGSRAAAGAWTLHRGPALRGGPGEGLATAGGRRAPVHRALGRGPIRRDRAQRDQSRFGHRGQLDHLGVLRPDDRQDHLLRADSPAGRGPARRRAGAHPHARGRHQPGPAGQRAAPPRVPGRGDRHCVLRHARLTRPGPPGRRRPHDRAVGHRRRPRRCRGQP